MFVPGRYDILIRMQSIACSTKLILFQAAIVVQFYGSKNSSKEECFLMTFQSILQMKVKVTLEISLGDVVMASGGRGVAVPVVSLHWERTFGGTTRC